MVFVGGATSMGSLELVDDALSSDSSMSMGSGVYIVLGVVIVDCMDCSRGWNIQARFGEDG